MTLDEKKKNDIYISLTFDWNLSFPWIDVNECKQQTLVVLEVPVTV